MVGAGEYQFAQPKLFDAPQSLELFGVDQVEEKPITRIVLERDDVMYRITDNFRPSGTHKGLPRLAKDIQRLPKVVTACLM